MEPAEITEILNRPLSQELLARDLTRLAYVAQDGTPRTIPIAFTWNGSQIVVCTTKNSPKLPSLRRHPEVALTIDTEGFPPHVLSLRGRVELEQTDGPPAEYVAAARRYLGDEQGEKWQAYLDELAAKGLSRDRLRP